METEQTPPTPPSNARVRIVVVGLGLIGRRHMELVQQSPRCELAALVDPDPRTATLADKEGVPWLRTLGDMLDADRPHGAVIATPNALHVKQAIECISAGIPVLVEKPIATTVADGLRLVETADREGVPLLVGHHRRHSPLLAAARRVIADGRLGQVVAVLATTLFAKPSEYFEAAPWRRELAGGGPILINLIHDVDALRTLVGDVVRVHALASSHVRGFPVEDTAAVAVEFANGAVGSLLLSDAAASPLSWEMTSGEDRAYPRYVDRDCYVVAGTRGTLGIPTLRLATADGLPSWHRQMPMSTIEVEPADPLVRQLEHFCDVIASQAHTLVSGRDAVESLRVTLAISEAVRTGCAVDCAPLLSQA